LLNAELPLDELKLPQMELLIEAGRF